MFEYFSEFRVVAFSLRVPPHPSKMGIKLGEYLSVMRNPARVYCDYIVNLVKKPLKVGQGVYLILLFKQFKNHALVVGFKPNLSRIESSVDSQRT